MKKFSVIFVICCLLFSNLALAKDDILRVYAGAGLKKPLDAVLVEYAKTNKQKIEVNYSASGGLYSQIVSGQPCDLFFSADWIYVEKLEAEKLLASSVKYLNDTIVLIVAPSSKDKVTSIQDLTKENITISIADKRAPVGGYSVAGLEKLGIYSKLEKNIKAMPSTVNQVAIMVQEDQIDAGLVFSSVAKMYNLDAVDTMDNSLTGEIIFGLATLKTDKIKEVNDLVNFMQANIKEFEKYGWKQYK